MSSLKINSSDKSKLQIDNQLTVSVEFYFKGEKIAASLLVNIDSAIIRSGVLPNFYPLLAKSIGLDLYSYEYEIMQSEELNFSDGKGSIKNYIENGKFDFDRFIEHWNKKNVEIIVQSIALEYLAIDNLSSHSKLKNALVQAYIEGTKTR